MKKLLLSGVSLVGLAAAPAMGADILMKAPPPMFYSWVGCYVGAAGGYAWGQSRAENDGIPGPITITGNYNVSGGIIGGTAGCNLLQSGSWMFGVESDLSSSGKKGSGNDLPPYNTATSNETRENWLNTDRVRVGYVANNWFLYATAGVAVANVWYSISNAAIIAGGSVSETHTRAGWTAGAGVEWALDRSWSVKTEYLYANFGGTAYFNFPGAIPGGIANRNGGVFLNDNIVRVGVNYKFGFAGPAVTKY